MAKSKKNLLWIGLVILAIAAYLAYSTGAFSGGLFATYAVGKSCSQATQIYTYGAQEGECFVSVLSNDFTLAYVDSVVEKERYGPSGLENFCTITYIKSDFNRILSCDVAYKSDGSTVKVCKTDTDCPDYDGVTKSCVNHMCREKHKETCSYGEVYCLSDKKFESCLNNGLLSGVQYCTSGNVCVQGKGCTAPTGEEPTVTEGTGTGTDTNNPVTGTADSLSKLFGLDLTTLIWIIGGIGLLLIILSMM